MCVIYTFQNFGMQRNHWTRKTDVVTYQAIYPYKEPEFWSVVMLPYVRVLYCDWYPYWIASRTKTGLVAVIPTSSVSERQARWWAIKGIYSILICEDVFKNIFRPSRDKSVIECYMNQLGITVDMRYIYPMCCGIVLVFPVLSISHALNYVFCDIMNKPTINCKGLTKWKHCSFIINLARSHDAGNIALEI